MGEEPRIISPYIYAVRIERKTKTSVWEIRNKKSDAVLGEVRWYAPWRQYCFFPVGFSTVFNKDCLNVIVSFIKQAEHERTGR